MTLTVACVMRSGGDFVPEHVWALKRRVNRYLQYPHEFRVLTDCDFAGPLGIRLVEALPGWWSKMELFRPGTFADPVLYFDLDTVPVGPLADLAAYRGQLALLADFYEPTRLQSGIMAWTPGARTAHLWERFAADPARAQRAFRGDGEFLNVHAEPRPERLQDLFPGQIVSYKRDVRMDEGTFSNAYAWRVPDGARVVCFHGQPRPWTTPLWEDGT